MNNINIKENDKLKLTYIVIGLIILSISILVASKVGSIDISFSELIYGLLTNQNEGNIGIIKDLRLPRVLVGVLIGSNLAISGVLLQAVMKNPLADPGITGISSGASLVSIIIMVFIPELINLKPILAFIGGGIAAILVYKIAYNEGLSPLRIVLAGIAMNAMLSSMASIITIFNGNSSSSIQMWLSGSLSAVSWSDVNILIIYSLVGITTSITLGSVCNLMVLGEKTAKSLGVDTNKKRILISSITVFLASVSTGIGGIISFVGLIVPHISRFIIGSNHKYLIPFSGVMGGILLLIADTLGRTIIRPFEIPVGLVMSVIGAPFFIYLLRKEKR